MLTREFLNIYGIVGITVMAVALLLIWLKVVPSEYYLPLFIIAFGIWISRLLMRWVLARREKREAVSDKETPTL